MIRWEFPYEHAEWLPRMCSNGLNHVHPTILTEWVFVTVRFINVRGLNCTNILYDVFIVILRRSSGQVLSHIVSLIYNYIFDWIIVLYLVSLYFVLFLQIRVQSSTFEMFLVVKRRQVKLYNNLDYWNMNRLGIRSQIWKSDLYMNQLEQYHRV